MVFRRLQESWRFHGFGNWWETELFFLFWKLFESCSFKHFTIFSWEGTSVCCTYSNSHESSSWPHHRLEAAFAGILTRKMEWTSSRQGISGWGSSPWEVYFELISAEAAIWKPRLMAAAKRWTRRPLAWRPASWEHQGSPAWDCYFQHQNSRSLTHQEDNSPICKSSILLDLWGWSRWVEDCLRWWDRCRRNWRLLGHIFFNKCSSVVFVGKG